MGAKYHVFAEDFPEIFDQENICIVEIGSENGDGSTAYFNELSKKYRCRFFSVDIDQKNFDFENSLFLFVNKSGEEFLENDFPLLTNDKIGILYLDNFDWIWQPRSIPDWIRAQIIKYKDNFGIEMNNIQSSVTHLKQIIRAFPYLAEKCLVICDDTWYAEENGVFMGKSAGVVYYLLANGFKVIKQNNADFALVLSNF